jgi:hypothetical protein
LTIDSEQLGMMVEARLKSTSGQFGAYEIRERSQAMSVNVSHIAAKWGIVRSPRVRILQVAPAMQHTARSSQLVRSS